jgi:hypothetical protein
MSAKCQKRTFSSLAKCQPWLRSPNLQQLPAMFTASALLRCHHVDMRRHNGNLLAPTFEALRLRCRILRNSLGTLERGIAFLAAVLIGWHGAAPKGPSTHLKWLAPAKPVFLARKTASWTAVRAYSTNEGCLSASSTVTGGHAGNCNTVAR